MEPGTLRIVLSGRSWRVDRYEVFSLDVEGG